MLFRSIWVPRVRTITSCFIRKWYKEIQNFLRNTIMLSTDLQNALCNKFKQYWVGVYKDAQQTHLVYVKPGLLMEKESPQEMTNFLMKMLGDANRDKKNTNGKFFCLTPPVGLEPTTSWLTVCATTNWAMAG